MDSEPESQVFLGLSLPSPVKAPGQKNKPVLALSMISFHKTFNNLKIKELNR